MPQSDVLLQELEEVDLEQESQPFQPRRPTLDDRKHSTSSQISLSSPSDNPNSNSVHHHRSQNHGHKSARHVVARPLASRNTSFGKGLHKLSKLNHDAATPTATPPSRPAPNRTMSGIAISPTSTSSPRPSHAVKRNASAFVVPRATSHSALKKNHSSGHLPRHGSSKNVSKAAKHQAPLMKRSRSSRSDASQKSPIEPHSPPHHTVRFDLGDDNAPGDTNDDNEDNDWTEDSTSLSPNTTRDHTRSNSMIIDSAMREAGDLSSSKSQVAPSPLADHASHPESHPQPNGTSTYHRTPSTHNIPTAGAITSRLLMRTPSTMSTAVSTVSATATGSPTPYSYLSHSQGSTLNEQTPSGSGGRDLVSRFINAGGSHDTPSELNGIVSRDNRERQPSDSSTEDEPIKAVEGHRRNRSVPHASKSTTALNHPPTTYLPPSRTQQKLELQRASSALEPAKHIPPVLPRPSAPQLLHSGMHAFGFGVSEGGHLPAQIQGLFSQIGKEYGVVRRFRRPIEDALGRIKKPATTTSLVMKGKVRATDSEQHTQTNQTQPQRRLKDSQPSPRQHQRPDEHHTAELERMEPQHLHSRKSRVSFEIPSRSVADEDHEDMIAGSEEGRTGEDEVMEICRRMWDLGNATANDKM